MKQPVNVLVVEDSEDDAKLAIRVLSRGGFDPTYRRVQTAADLESTLMREHWDAVISDFSMPGFTGMDALRIFRSTGLDIPFLLISGIIGEEIAVTAMNAGASDYIMKTSLARLAPALERELNESRIRAAHRKAEADLVENGERFRQMAKHIRDAFFLVDVKSSRMLYISPAYEEIWGRTCESLYADPGLWAEAIHPDDRPSAVANFARCRNGQLGGKFDDQYRIVRPDGSIRWLEVSVYPIRGDAGRIVRMTGIAKDLTNRRQAAQDLRESEARFRSLTELSSDWYWQQDETLRFTSPCNGTEIEAGLEPESDLGKTRWELSGIGAADWETHKATLAAHLPFRDFEFDRTFPDGSVRNVTISGEPVFGGGGDFAGYRGTGRDITERKQADARIQRLNRTYAVLSGINTLIVRVHDRDELFRGACRIAVEHGGFRMCWIGIVDRDAMSIVPVASAGEAAGFLQQVQGRLSLKDDSPEGHGVTVLAVGQNRAVVVNDVATDARIRHKSAHADRGFRSMVSLPLSIGHEAIAVFDLHSAETEVFDAAEMKLLGELAGNLSFALDHIDKARKLDYLAYYDAMTGLANQSLFLERLQEKLSASPDDPRKKAVFVLDIERFKSINDAFGRIAGDELLKQMAARLVHSRGGDASRFARIGPDRFAIVASDLDSVEHVGRFLEQRLDATFRAPFRVGETELRVSVKVGIALFPDDGADADTLLRNAEAALKKAKGTGDRYLFFTQAMTERVAERLSLEHKLRQALDNEEFVLHYQPKINLVTGKVTGAEGLIRWNDPRSGLVAPGQFIPILEETGMIHDVGRWALRKAVADHLRWRATGLNAVRIAVNVSPLQLRDRGFVAEIEHAIGVDPRAAAGLELEITESTIMADVEQNIASLQAIRAMGVGVAIDDFGTGFSSLSYLSKLPVDTLKIDRSFVVDMTITQEGLALVSTIVSLAHALKLKVVAEGVETEEQSRLLRLLGCDEMQGFLFSRPIPCEIFESKYLATRER